MRVKKRKTNPVCAGAVAKEQHKAASPTLPAVRATIQDASK